MNTRTTVGSGGPVAGADGSVKVKTGRTRQWNPLPEGTETSFEKTMAMTVQFSSVQDGIYTLGNAHNYAFHSVSQKFRQGVLVLK